MTRQLIVRLWRRFGRAFALLLFVLALVSPSLGLAGMRERSARPGVPSAVLIQPVKAEEVNIPAIQVGLHVRNIYGLSLADQSFLAEGWYWYEWGDDVQQILKRRNIDPDEILEIANEIELGQYSVQQVSSSSQAILTPGKEGRIVRFSGKFYIQDVPQHQAPFDPQRLTLALEVKPEYLALGADRVRLQVKDPASSIVGEDVGISGYVLDAVEWQQYNVIYPREFLPDMVFSRLTAIFVFGKNAWAVFMKWIFPVLVIMAIVIVSPSIEGVLGDIRIAIPPSALLTLVVMQDGYKSSFPPAPYLTYLDEIYVYSYFVCLVVFLLFLLGANLVERAADGDRMLVASRVNRFDLVVQVGAVIGFVFVVVVGWFT